MPKVSVVVPVYNVSKYLAECIDSICRQSLQDIEIICVDDGSTDGSSQILDEYAKKDSRVKVIHKNNEGYGKAVNVGMDAAQSPYIGLVESDDWIEPNMYSDLYDLMEKNNADVIKADFYESHVTPVGQRIEEYIALYAGANADSLYNTNISILKNPEAWYFVKYTWSGLYRTSFLRDNNIKHNETPGASYQDNGFWFQTFMLSNNIYFDRHAYYHYRIDNLFASTFASGKVHAVSDEYDFVNKIIDGIKDRDFANQFYKWSCYFRFRDCIGNINRVSKENKPVMADIVRKEFIRETELGHVDEALLDNNLKTQIFSLLCNKKDFIEKYDNARLRFINHFKDYDMIILYGAGNIARQVFPTLRDGRIHNKICYFAVTDVTKNPPSICGVPVRCIDDLTAYKDTALVVIATRAAVQPTVALNLIKKGFKNCIVYSDLF